MLINPEGVDFLIALIDKAGDAIMNIYDSTEPISQGIKSDDSPLTQADLAANSILVDGLTSRWPNIPILSEESSNNFSAGENPPLYWAVDPLDGTKEFIKKNGEFTVNVALIVEGVAEIGFVYAPAIDCFYMGHKSKLIDLPSGAKKRNVNGWQTINTSGAKNGLDIDRPYRFAMSRSHPSKELEDWLRSYSSYETSDIGSSLKFCLVADGSVDAYPRLGPTCIWDTAAGSAVVSSAGGRVTTLDKVNLIYPQPYNIKNPFFVAWG